MAKAKFTQYYKDAMNKALDYIDEKQRLCIRLEEITGESATITIGVSDGNKMVLEFGTISLRKDYTVHVCSDNIYMDMHGLIKMEYNSVPESDCAMPLIEAWNN